MKLRLLFINAERRDENLLQEICKAVTAIKKYQHTSKACDFIDITSISVIKNKTEDEISIVELKHSCRDENLNNFLPGDTATLSSEDEFHANDFYCMAEHLHAYADTIEEEADTSLYILWCVKDYIPNPSEVVEFYGSLERLKLWKNACLSIITNNFGAIEEWLPFLPFQTVGSVEEIIESILCTVWRGALAFSVEGKNGLSVFPEVVLKSENKNTDLFRFNGLRDTADPLYVIPVAEVFTDVDLNTIPWACIQRGSFCTLVTSPCLNVEDTQEVSALLNLLSSTPSTATLFRIRHSHKPPSLQNLDFTNTRCWKQNIADGRFDLRPILSFEGFHEVTVFLILPGRYGSDGVDCVVLQDPTVFGEDVVKLVSQEQLKRPVENEALKLKVLDLMKETFELSQLQDDVLCQLFANLPKIVKERLDEKLHAPENLWDELKLQIECGTSKAVLSHLLSTYPSSQVQLRPLKPFQTEIDLPKECLPEWKALEERDRRSNNSILRCTSGDFLCGLPPPLPSSRRGIATDVTSLLNSLEEERKRIANAQGTKSRCKVEMSNVKWLRNLSWREAVHTKWHGIYYNNEQQEKLETLCSRLRDRAVRRETASTCTLFQCQDLNAQSKHRTRLSNEPECKEVLASSLKPVRDLDTASIVSSAKSLSFKNGERKRTRASPRKNLYTTLRRSPRKRVKVEVKEDLKPSDLLKERGKTEAKKKVPVRNPKPADLSEVHKQKLRNVILSALESEGVQMKNEIFKLCFKKMFAVCKPFALDVAGVGGTTRSFDKIAKAHVKQVVHFEKRKSCKRK